MADRLDLIFDILKGKDTLTPALKKPQKEATGLQKTISNLGSSLAAVAGPLAIAAAGFATFKIGKGLIDAASQVEDLSVSFEVLTGSAENARGLIQDLTEFAAQTPFQLEGIASATKQLLAFGFEQENIIPRLKEIGDVAAASGSDLKEVALIYGQVAAAGKLTGERLLQLQERAIPIGPAIAKTMRIAEREVRDAVSKGEVSLKKFQEAFASLSAEGGQFADGMIKQSKTLSGLLSTLKDNIFLVASEIGQELLPVAKQLASGLIDLVKGFRDLVKEGGAVRKTMTTLFGTETEKQAIRINTRIQNLRVGVKNLNDQLAKRRAGKVGFFEGFFDSRNEKQLSAQIQKNLDLISQLTKQRDALSKQPEVTATVKVETPKTKEIIEENIFQIRLAVGDQLTDNLKKAFQNIPGLIATSFTQGAEGARSLATGLSSAIIGAFSPVLGKVAGPIINLLSQGPEKVRETIDSFTESIPGLIENIVASLPVLIERLVIGLVDAFDRIAERADIIVERLATGLARAAPKIVAALAAQAPFFAIKFSNALIAQAPNIAVAFIDELVKGAPRVIEEMIESIPSSVGGALGFDGGGGGIPIISDIGGAIGGLFSKGGVIPPGFPNDSFVAGVTSGERVLTPEQNRLFEQQVLGRGDTDALLGQILSVLSQGQQVNAVIQIGQEELSRVILNLNRNNARLA